MVEHLATSKEGKGEAVSVAHCIDTCSHGGTVLHVLKLDITWR